MQIPSLKDWARGSAARGTEEEGADMDEDRLLRSGPEDEAEQSKAETSVNESIEAADKENSGEKSDAEDRNAGTTRFDRRNMIRAGIAAAALILLVICCFGINSLATSMGRGVGNVSGTLVGAAVGSANGIKDGVTEGIQAGIEEGLSAEDTKVELGQAIKSVGKLEVLVAGVTLESINRIGNAYTGLYVIAGDAVFTVDLAETEVLTSEDGSQINISIPEPELSLFLDQSSTEKLAEVQNFSWTVSAEDGLKEYLNSMAKTKEETEEYLSNYSELMDSARDAAVTQVGQLASRLNVGNAAVRVVFREEDPTEAQKEDIQE